MTVSERMSNAGLVPVVVLENAADAVTRHYHMKNSLSLKKIRCLI